MGAQSALVEVLEMASCVCQDCGCWEYLDPRQICAILSMGSVTCTICIARIAVEQEMLLDVFSYFLDISL